MKPLILTIILTILLIPTITHAQIHGEETLIPNSKSYTAIFEDINNDGTKDLLELGYGKNTVYLQNKNGEFVKQENHGLEGELVLSTGAIFGDYNKDGNIDIFIINYGTENTLFSGIGNGNFEIITDIPLTQTKKFTKQADFVDIDADGDLDLFILNSFGLNELYINTNGIFQLQENILTEQTRTKKVIWKDMDDDGDIDAVFAKKGLKLFINDGYGGFEEEMFIEDLQTKKIRDIQIKDFDGDSDFDVFVHTGINSFSIYENDNNTFEKKSLNIDKTNAYFSKSFLEDIDGDDDLDIIFFEKMSTKMHIYKNEHGIYSKDDTNAFGDIFDEQYIDAVFEDIDNDGDGDVYFIGKEHGEIAKNLFDPKNLVINGNMEDLGYTWRNWSHPIVFGTTDQYKKTGDTSIYIDATGVHAGIQQLHIPVEMGKKYTFSFWYNTNCNTYVTLNNNDSNGDMSGKKIKLNSTDGTWQKYERTFRILDIDTYDFRARISLQNGVGYLDDMKLIEQKETNVIKDSLLGDIGIDNWNGWGGSTDWSKTQEKAHSEDNSILLDGTIHGGAGMYQRNIELEKDKTYKLSFYYQVYEGTELYYSLGDNDANRDIENRKNKFTKTLDGEWVYYERLVKGEWFTQNALLRFSTRYGKAFIDDIFLEEVEGMKIIQDGDMEEAHTNMWKGYARSIAFEKTENEFTNGSRSLKLDGSIVGWAGAYQNQLSIRQDMQYKLRFNYKIESGTFYAILGDNSANSDIENSGARFTSTEGAWVPYERMFNGSDFVLNNATFRMSIGDSGIAYIDDVVIEEIPELEE
jgi:hypothetical protein